MGPARETVLPLHSLRSDGLVDDAQRAPVAESLPALALLLPDQVAGDPRARRSAP